jgi:LuxR family maltose regulon positive regulatory protein
MLAAAHSGLIERPRIVDRLRRSASSARLVLLDAPAGYSKTTCLAQWDAADQRPFLTVASTARHDDPSLLAAAIIDALERIHPVDNGVPQALAAVEPDMDEVLVRLGQTMARLPEPFVLAIDDVHLLRSAASRRVLAHLVDLVPIGSQVAMATRRDAPVPTGRLRSERALLEIGTDELAMTREEAGKLLASLGIKLSAEQVATLHERTEGWPAALCLAASALGEQADLDSAVAAFAGDDRIVVDYLRDELLAALPRKSMDFLLRASLLEELSGPLCDAALERSDSAELLRKLSRRNALIVPLDRVDERYRCHHLLADMLGSELRRRMPEEQAGIHGRAAAWYAAAGESDHAIEHAIAAGDAVLAGDLIWASIPRLLGRGRVVSLDRWLAGLGDAAAARSPGLALSAAHRNLSLGDSEEAARYADMVEAAVGDEVDPRVRADVLLVRAILADDGIHQMAQDAALSTELQGVDSAWQFVTSYYRGVALHLSGHPDRAAPLLRDCARRGAAIAPFMQVLALAQLALVALESGEPAEAESCISQATSQVERCGLSRLPSMAMVSAVAARVHAEAGRVEEASACLDRGYELYGELTVFIRWYKAQAGLALAQAAIRLDDADRAGELLECSATVMADGAQGPCLDDWLAAATSALAAAARDRSDAGLTKAELRTLQYLPTHLTFREIGERLYLSANTVKTQARAVYRKLDATSRAEAVHRAREAGLLDDGNAT